MKEHLKWIFTKWHFWVLTSVWAILTLIQDISYFGSSNAFGPGNVFGIFASSLLVFLVIYAIVAFIRWAIGKSQKTKKK